MVVFPSLGFCWVHPGVLIPKGMGSCCRPERLCPPSLVLGWVCPSPGSAPKSFPLDSFSGNQRSCHRTAPGHGPPTFSRALSSPTPETHVWAWGWHRFSAPRPARPRPADTRQPRSVLLLSITGRAQQCRPTEARKACPRAAPGTVTAGSIRLLLRGHGEATHIGGQPHALLSVCL